MLRRMPRAGPDINVIAVTARKPEGRNAHDAMQQKSMPNASACPSGSFAPDGAQHAHSPTRDRLRYCAARSVAIRSAIPHGAGPQRDRIADCAFLQRTIRPRQIAKICGKSAGWSNQPWAGSNFATGLPRDPAAPRIFVAAENFAAVWWRCFE